MIHEWQQPKGREVMEGDAAPPRASASAATSKLHQPIHGPSKPASSKRDETPMRHARKGTLYPSSRRRDWREGAGRESIAERNRKRATNRKSMCKSACGEQGWWTAICVHSQTAANSITRFSGRAALPMILLLQRFTTFPYPPYVSFFRLHGSRPF